MLALAKLPHSGAVAVVRQLRRPSLKRRHEQSYRCADQNQKSRKGPTQRISFQRGNPDPSFNVADAILEDPEFVSVLRVVLRDGHK